MPRKPKQWTLETDKLPPLPRGITKTLYVCGADPADTAVIRRLGYRVVDVRTMERGSPGQSADAIEAWLQGMAEGTIEPDLTKLKALELEAKVHGLLVNRTLRIDAKAKLDGENLEALLESLAPSKQTLMNVSSQRIEKAKQAALIPGIKLDDEEVH